MKLYTGVMVLFWQGSLVIGPKSAYRWKIFDRLYVLTWPDRVSLPGRNSSQSVHKDYSVQVAFLDYRRKS